MSSVFIRNYGQYCRHIIWQISDFVHSQEWRWAVWKMRHHMLMPLAIFRHIRLFTTRSADFVAAVPHKQSLTCKNLGFITILLHPSQVPGYMVSQERRDWREYSPAEQQPLPPTHHPGPHAELQYGQCHYPSPISRAWPGSHTENGNLQYTQHHEYNIHTLNWSNNIWPFNIWFVLIKEDFK